MTGKFQRLDLSHITGRVFVVGDIHGAFSALEAELEKRGFDREKDVLLSVGDLVDRGPESHRAVEFLDYPWFHAIQGNHEDIVLNMAGTDMHNRNGGRWWKKLKYSHNKPNHVQFLVRFNKLPIILEVLLPSGRRIGLVHAEYPGDDWADAEYYANNHSEHCMWARIRYKDARDEHVHRPLDGVERVPPIKGIDHVYYGHTPLTEAITVGNQSWIDTGAVFSDGFFTIIEEK